MREILSRGKRVDNGELIEGFYAKSGDRTFILIDNDFAVGYVIMKEVYPETVGEYTGLTDKNGKKIFEGDIVKTWRNTIGKIEFGQYWDEETEEDFYGYAWIGKDEYGESITLSLNKCWNGHEVIGNIYDNPELLEVKE